MKLKIPITDTLIFDLDHPAGRVRELDSMILTSDGDGHLTLIDLEKSSQISLDLKIKIDDASFSKRQKVISMTERESGALTFLDFAGNRLSSELPPKFESDYPETIKYKFLACYFEESEKYFLCAVLVSDFEIEIQLRDAGTLALVDKTIVEDPFGDALWSFHSTNKPGLFSLYIGAGQDGQEVRWVEIINDKVSCHDEPVFFNTPPPVFSPPGNEFLILDDDGESVIRYQYPAVKTGSCQWPENGVDDSFSYGMDFLNEDLALISSDGGRLFLLEVKKMEFVGEVMIEGHEPRPAVHHWAGNVTTHYFASDIRYYEKSPNRLICGYNRIKDFAPRVWKDSIMVIGKDKILSQI